MRTAILATPQHFVGVADHFLELGPRDRFLRFGCAMTEAQIVAYVQRLLGSGDTTLVVVEPLRRISGVLHLESVSRSVTLGLTVSPRKRGLGIGTLLLQRAQLLARARGLRMLFVRNLNANAALQKLAVGLGMPIACTPATQTTSLQLPAENSGDDAFAAKITLADDSLRPREIPNASSYL